MKIIMVITGLGLGGAEKQVCLLADQLSQNMYDVTIVSLCGEIKTRPESKDIKVIDFSINKTPFGVIKALFKLRFLIAKLQPDVIHGHMFHANIISRLASIGVRRKLSVISTAHSKNEGSFLRMFAYRLTDMFCDLCTNVSDEALKEFIKLKAFKAGKSIAVHNGIDTERFSFDNITRLSVRGKNNIANDDVLLLAVGRLTHAKDYPNLLSALKMLPEKYRLLIIGEGELRSEIEELVLHYNLDARVTLLGVKDDVSPYYSACDIFVLSSAWEGFGLVVAEAMSCERLAIVTDAGGVREVLGNDRFVVPISNSVLLAKKIVEVAELNDEDTKVIMLQNRKRVLDNFSITEVVTKWESIYTKLHGSK